MSAQVRQLFLFGDVQSRLPAEVVDNGETGRRGLGKDELSERLYTLLTLRTLRYVEFLGALGGIRVGIRGEGWD